MADISIGKVVFALVCDGMGRLQRGIRWGITIAALFTDSRYYVMNVGD